MVPGEDDPIAPSRPAGRTTEADIDSKVTMVRSRPNPLEDWRGSFRVDWPPRIWWRASQVIRTGNWWCVHRTPNRIRKRTTTPSPPATIEMTRRSWNSRFRPIWPCDRPKSAGADRSDARRREAARVREEDRFPDAETQPSPTDDRSKAPPVVEKTWTMEPTLPGPSRIVKVDARPTDVELGVDHMTDSLVSEHRPVTSSSHVEADQPRGSGSDSAAATMTDPHRRGVGVP